MKENKKKSFIHSHLFFLVFLLLPINLAKAEIKTWIGGNTGIGQDNWLFRSAPVLPTDLSVDDKFWQISPELALFTPGLLDETWKLSYAGIFRDFFKQENGTAFVHEFFIHNEWPLLPAMVWKSTGFGQKQLYSATTLANFWTGTLQTGPSFSITDSLDVAPTLIANGWLTSSNSSLFWGPGISIAYLFWNMDIGGKLFWLREDSGSTQTTVGFSLAAFVFDIAIWAEFLLAKIDTSSWYGLALGSNFWLSDQFEIQAAYEGCVEKIPNYENIVSHLFKIGTTYCFGCDIQHDFVSAEKEGKNLLAKPLLSKLIFILKDVAEAKTIRVISDFNNWQSSGVLMQREKNGQFKSAIIMVKPGPIYFFLLINGVQCIAKKGATLVSDGFGGLNMSVLIGQQDQVVELNAIQCNLETP